MSAKPRYKRVLLKASGEALMGSQGFGIDVAVADRIASDIAEARALGVEVGVVVGGGNIFRGVAVAFKGTQVDGIYSADPKKVPDATRFDRLTHSEVLEKGLAVMDVAAVALARENSIPIIVFSIHEKGGFAEILTGGGRGTIVTDN